MALPWGKVVTLEVGKDTISWSYRSVDRLFMGTVNDDQNDSHIGNGYDHVPWNRTPLHSNFENSDTEGLTASFHIPLN